MKPKLNYRRTVLVGLAFLSISAFWQLYEQTVPLMLKETFGQGDTLTGAIMALDNVLALILLPLFGALSDRCKSRLGKRMPFIIVGTAVSVVAMNLLPIADNIASLPLFMAALLIVLLAMSVYRSPAVALMPDVTPKPLRSKGNAVINLMGSLGGVLALGMIGVLVADAPDGGYGRVSYTAMFAAVSLVMAIAVIVLVMTIRERKLSAEVDALPTADEAVSTDNGESLSPAARRSLLLILFSVAFWFMGYNAITTAFSRYAQTVWGMGVGQSSTSLLIANAGAIVAFIPAGILATRYGRKRVIPGGVLLLTASFAGAMAVTSFSPLVYVLFAVVGCAWACINVNSYPMVVALGGQAHNGRYTGFYYTFSMSAQILTPILSGFLLEHVGYWTLFPYAALMVLFSFVTISLVRREDGSM
ncbi:MAG: MFS transporter [Oscillospiraceae bacterium]|jgi:Na+/melibiose symporter-like transporter|nr:MFS transporter [Oscillospiraceae bacterium]